ncbi:MAG TPA: DNA methyltransferase [Methyloceanibacter sp.]|jgi:site-specific DNA-methyltransferase (adenine-specific)|nr:DNA methyltransferase [Methyloceanibacter sp.]
MTNKLYYGDNLRILRDHIASESVDLVYLDPPFNSNATYNVLFRSPAGEQSQAQIEAFEDTWHWNEAAEHAFDDVVKSGNSDAAEMLRALRSFLGENDMMAYLAMMAVRLLELHRVLKPAGSLYLHCDPTASHYLKVLLHGVFGPTKFRNEIVWKRTHSHGDPHRKFGAITDTLLFYTKSDEYILNPQYREFAPDYIERTFTGNDADGRRWQSVTLRSPHPRPNLTYPYIASNDITYQPHVNGWSCDIERMKKYDRENRLHFPSSPTGALRLKMYLDESPGVKVPPNPHHRGCVQGRPPAHALDRPVGVQEGQARADDQAERTGFVSRFKCRASTSNVLNPRLIRYSNICLNRRGGGPCSSMRPKCRSNRYGASTRTGGVSACQTESLR